MLVKKSPLLPDGLNKLEGLTAPRISCILPGGRYAGQHLGGFTVKNSQNEVFMKGMIDLIDRHQAQYSHFQQGHNLY